MGMERIGRDGRLAARNGGRRRLVPAWTFATGVNEGHEAPPIVNNGVMFIATPQAQVIALDAKSGEEIWRYKRQLPEDLFQLHPTSRGVGLWQDKLFLASTDDHLVALDAKTGKVAWDQKVQDYKKGQYMTLMPLVVATSSPTTPMTGRSCGAPSPFQALARPVTIPGAATTGRAAAGRPG